MKYEFSTKICSYYEYYKNNQISENKNWTYKIKLRPNSLSFDT